MQKKNVYTKFNSISWRMEAKRDRFTKEITPFNEINGIKNIYCLDKKRHKNEIILFR